MCALMVESELPNVVPGSGFGGVNGEGGALFSFGTDRTRLSLPLVVKISAVPCRAQHRRGSDLGH